MLNVMISESDLVTAMGLEALVSKADSKINAEYFLNADQLYEAAEKRETDLFVISVSSAQDDPGVCLARRLRQTGKYKTTFIIFLSKAGDEKVEKIILSGFQRFGFLMMPIDEMFHESLLTALEDKFPKTEEEVITLFSGKVENTIKLIDILWIESGSAVVGKVEKKVVTINLVNGNTYRYQQSEYSLKLLEMMLGNGFLRIYKQVIVNKHYAENFIPGARQIMLENIDRIFKVGVTYVEIAKQCFCYDKPKDEGR